MLPRQDLIIFHPKVSSQKPIRSRFVVRCDLTPEHCMEVLLNEQICPIRSRSYPYVAYQTREVSRGDRAVTDDAHEPSVEGEERTAGVATGSQAIRYEDIAVLE